MNAARLAPLTVVAWALAASGAWAQTYDEALAAGASLENWKQQEMRKAGGVPPHVARQIEQDRLAAEREFQRQYPGKTRAQVNQERSNQRAADYRRTERTLLAFLLLVPLGGAAVFAGRHFLLKPARRIDAAAVAHSDPWVRAQLARGQELPPQR